jgi:hypothetical protein
MGSISLTSNGDTIKGAVEAYANRILTACNRSVTAPNDVDGDDGDIRSITSSFGNKG